MRGNLKPKSKRLRRAQLSCEHCKKLNELVQNGIRDPDEHPKNPLEESMTSRGLLTDMEELFQLSVEHKRIGSPVQQTLRFAWAELYTRRIEDQELCRENCEQRTTITRLNRRCQRAESELVIARRKIESLMKKFGNGVQDTI